MAVITKIKKGADEYDIQDPNAATKTELQALETTVSGKQDALTETQLAAVNSGIDSTKVGQIAINASDIDTIEGKIPSAATAQNQLADKSYVDTADNGLQSQIDAISASSDVKDIVGTKAELNSYDTSTLGNNDIIKVLQDESENDATTYYRWSTSTNSFTLIGEEGPYYTKSQANALLDDKVDKVTGKGLSENDFTTTLKDKLDGIEAGAEVNDINSISVNGTAVTPDANKNVDLMIPGETIKKLTEADYNYRPSGTGDNNSVAAWKLPSGMYYHDGSITVYGGIDTRGNTKYQVGANTLIQVVARDNSANVYFYSPAEFTGRNLLWYALMPVNGTASTILQQQSNLSDSPDFYNPSLGYNIIPTHHEVYTVAQRIGALTDLTTTSKTSAVSAINEVNAKAVAFTGTDGTSAGTMGLVPAPATTDAGKFLKSDGSWDTAGGSAVTQLTSADLNYPATGTKTTLATWSLAPGNYSFYNDSDSNKTLKMASDSSMQFSVKAGETIDFLVQRVAWSSTSDSVYLVRTYVATSNKIYAAIAYNTNGNAPDGSASTQDSIILTQHNITNTTGTSTTDVMSQNAVTGMVFADPGTNSQIQIGPSSSSTGLAAIAIGSNTLSSAHSGVAVGILASAGGNYSIALGRSAYSLSESSVSIGNNARTETQPFSVALGAGSYANMKGQVDISTVRYPGNGYNSSNYRLLTGLYDPQNAHDAATKGYVDTAVASAGASAFTTNEWNALWS